MGAYEDSAYKNYWAGILSMDKEGVLENLKVENLKCLSDKELCKLFKFLSCFFCCLAKDHCDCDKHDKKDDCDKKDKE